MHTNEISRKDCR